MTFDMEAYEKQKAEYKAKQQRMKDEGQARLCEELTAYEPEAYLLVKFEDNYADEFDVDGFRLLRGQQWIEHVKEIVEGKYPCEYGLGTNEWIEYEHPYDMLETFKVHRLTEEQYAWMEGLFPRAQGWFAENYSW